MTRRTSAEIKQDIEEVQEQYEDGELSEEEAVEKLEVLRNELAGYMADTHRPPKKPDYDY